ncbi:MAG: hypothetical protein A2W76_02680 [Gammaproteobacteria bacterium RIFCSPLOWO2_12_47_11]|nr:MAG: hypothetical protein A2W76_02680 [Gammaproteobacteria bacterium RIFCSPLOWO2_12_47_11]
MADIRPGENLIFVCGCGHSGTTLLWAMLSAHPDIYGINYETEVFLSSYRNNRHSLGPTRNIVVNFYYNILPSKHKRVFRRLGRKGYFSFTRTKESILVFFEKQMLAAHKENKRFICEKTPRHVLRIDQIRKLYPGSKIIVIVRNGLDVTASLKERWGNFRNAMERWVKDNSKMLEFRKKYDFHLLKYEDLITSPREELENICKYCDIKMHGSMLQHDKTADSRQWELELRRNQVHRHLTDRRGRWKESLDSHEVEQFMEYAGEMMIKLDYKLD